MIRSLRISDVQVSGAGQRVELSARINGHPANNRLWFRFPASYAGWLSPTPEAFVAALLPVAMALGADLEADSAVCPRFASGCQEIARIYRSWDRRLHPVTLGLRTNATARRPAGSAVACFFTGGVDSFYTVLKNLGSETGDLRITNLLFVGGYSDCPLSNEALFQRLTSMLSKAGAALSLSLIAATTNLQRFTPCAPPGWDWFAGSQLASVALALRNGLRRALIPAGDTYSTLSPWGSHPVVDPLWSTAKLEFLHDGAEAWRSQKLERVVAPSTVALRHLRVCGYEREGRSNCGICEKCLRTRTGLAALGVHEPPGLFAAPFDIARVRQMDGGDRVVGYYLRDNLQLLEATGLRPDLEAAVQDALRPNPARWVIRKAQWAGREADRSLLGGRIRAWALAAAGDDVERQTALRVAPHRWILEELCNTRDTAAGGRRP